MRPRARAKAKARARLRARARARTRARMRVMVANRPVEVPRRDEDVSTTRQVDGHARRAFGERVVLERATNEHRRLWIQAQSLDETLSRVLERHEVVVVGYDWCWPHM